MLREIKALQDKQGDLDALPTYVYKSYGKPGRQTKVKYALVDNPLKMMKGGMEEFIFKKAKIVNYGEQKKPNVYLH